jgi:DNA-binding GntR family transcriptional regulator
LRNRILRLELRPGDRLLEEELAREWRASRTPIREACKRLAQAGLVRAVPRRGYYVRDLDLTEIEELYEVRVAIESFAVTLAVERGRAADWSALARDWAAPPDPLPAPQAMLELDERFHVTIAEAGGNRVLVEHLLSVNERIRAVRAKDFTLPGRARATYEQHTQILGLITGGDGARASAAMREHILESKANAIHAVKELLAAVYLQQRRGAR